MAVVTDTPALGVLMPPVPPWYTARARDIWPEDIWAEEAWSAGTEAAAGIAGTVVVVVAVFSINVAVDAVVLALLSDAAADKETGMLTRVPA